MLWKDNTDGSNVIYSALYMKSVLWFYYETLKFQFFDVAFLILLSVCLRKT